MNKNFVSILTTIDGEILCVGKHRGICKEYLLVNFEEAVIDCFTKETKMLIEEVKPYYPMWQDYFMANDKLLETLNCPFFEITTYPVKEQVYPILLSLDVNV